MKVRRTAEDEGISRPPSTDRAGNGAWGTQRDDTTCMRHIVTERGRAGGCATVLVSSIHFTPSAAPAIRPRRARRCARNPRHPPRPPFISTMAAVPCQPSRSLASRIAAAVHTSHAKSGSHCVLSDMLRHMRTYASAYSSSLARRRSLAQQVHYRSSAVPFSTVVPGWRSSHEAGWPPSLLRPPRGHYVDAARSVLSCTWASAANPAY